MDIEKEIEEILSRNAWGDGVIDMDIGDLRYDKLLEELLSFFTSHQKEVEREAVEGFVQMLKLETKAGSGVGSFYFDGGQVDRINVLMKEYLETLREDKNE
jgi:hypothetical protein